jgi:ABC-type nitrate/sulfonate/bicarbonate transport system substrate-binding protein
VRSIDEASAYINVHPKEAKQFLKKYLASVYHSQIDLYPDPLYLLSADSRDDLYARVAKKYLDIGIIPRSIELEGAVYHGDRVLAAR